MEVARSCGKQNGMRRGQDEIGWWGGERSLGGVGCNGAGWDGAGLGWAGGQVRRSVGRTRGSRLGRQSKCSETMCMESSRSGVCLSGVELGSPDHEAESERRAACGVQRAACGMRRAREKPWRARGVLT